MSEIGTKQLSPESLDELIKEVFSDKAIAMIERCFCQDGQTPDFFDFLSELESDVSDWDRGRAFDGNSEVRWERDGREFHVVWIRDDREVPSEWQTKQRIEFVREKRALLWGKRIEDKVQWYEKQVPKILVYPVSEEGERVYALLNEYCLEDRSIVYRFKGVKEK